MDRDEQYFKAILFHYFDTLDKMVFDGMNVIILQCL